MSGLTPDEGPVFHLEPLGMLANRMIQYMVALKFVSLVPGCRISNIHLDEWNIHHPAIESPGPARLEQAQQTIDMVACAAEMNEGRIRRVEWSGYGQRLEYLLPREAYANVFMPSFRTPVGFGSEYLVCHVRAGEILNGSAPNYPLTPVEFFAELVETTGLKPVFMGQTAANVYTRRLRQRFPDAIFLDPRDIVLDFETMRQSKNLAIGVSTYAWLAAWLSQADNIFMTVNGLFNPMQKTDVNLLPFGDDRFKFALFPIHYAVPVEHHEPAHRRIAPYWRFVSHEALSNQLAEAPRFARNLETMLDAFDEHYYVSNNGDVKDNIKPGGFTYGREHYIRHGFGERRFPFRLDHVWYSEQYPMAAFEVSQGDYADFSHHYVAIGKARGYRPTPG